MDEDKHATMEEVSELFEDVEEGMNNVSKELNQLQREFKIIAVLLFLALSAELIIFGLLL